VRVRGGHERQGDLVQPPLLAHEACALGEGVVDLVVELVAPDHELDGDVPLPVQLEQPGDLALRRAGRAAPIPVGHERAHRPQHRTLAAAGKHEPVPLAGEPGELGQAVARCGLLPAVQVGARDRGRQ
jgi:hypothetical protein